MTSQSVLREEIQQPFWSRPQPADTEPFRLLSKRTVLIIDDDALLVELMAAVLSEAGFNVLTATSGAQGLALLRQTPEDVQVVLLDYQMPVTTGAQVLPQVRQLVPAAKVLGVSGTDPDELPPEFRDGVDKLLGKPFHGDELVAQVTALLPAEPAAANRGTELQPFLESAGRSGAPVVVSPASVAAAKPQPFFINYS